MIAGLLQRACSPYCITACIILGCLGALHAQQAGERVVNANDVPQIDDAVLISNVAVAGKTVECGLFIKPPGVMQPVTPFQAGNDWLKNMTISLINRTNKTIVFGSVIIHFLDTGDCHALPCVSANLEVGKRPAAGAYDGRTGQPLRLDHPDRAPLEWDPEQTLVVHVSDYMEDIERRVSESMSIAAISKLNIYRGSFFFSDGMRWNLGRYSIADPEHRGKFKALPADYFPGRRGNNWPPGYSQ